MATVAVTVTEVLSTLNKVCHSTCPVTRKQTMIALDQFQACDNYVEALVRIIDVHDLGSSMSVDCRHLAAVLLKNLVGKRGGAPAQQTSQSGQVRPLYKEERLALKAFLVRYTEEPQCKVAVQLSLVTAKLARQDGDQWLQEWPQLIPSLVSAIQAYSAPNQSDEQAHTIDINSPRFLRCMRAVSTLDEVMTELSSRACSASSSSSFGKSFATLCAQLYPAISKNWAENMKKIQNHLSKLNAQAATGNVETFGTSVTGLNQAELESQMVYTVLLSKVLRTVLMYGMETICATYTNFFRTFFKVYMGSLRVLAEFVRKQRALVVALRQSSAHSRPSCSRDGSYVTNLLVCMKTQLMGDEDVDDMCDAYASLDFASGNTDHENLLSFINLTMKLVKSLVCAPVMLQKKFPLLLVPVLGCMLEYYYTLLQEEFSTLCTQPGELSQLRLDAAGGVMQAAPTHEQQVQLYHAQQARDALPLNYMTKAAVMFLSLVLSCSSYADGNMYATAQPGSEQHDSKSVTSAGDESTCPMEESGQLRGSVAGASGLRKAFFTAERVTVLVRMLLYPLLSYCDKELEIWADCPEEFVLAQDSITETYSVKSAAESMFAGLIELVPETVCSILCPMLMDCDRQGVVLSAQVAVPCRLRQYLTSRELKLYDAVYICAGLGVAHLAPYLTELKKQCESSGACRPGNAGDCGYTSLNGVSTACVEAELEAASYWVQHYLGPMLQQLLVSPNAGCLLPGNQQLLRARLVWLLSLWMHKFDVAVLPHVLSMLIDIIGPAGDSDTVVKMHAIQALQALINLEIFDISSLKFHVVSAVEALCLLVRQLEESDNKITVLEVAGELIRLLSVQMNALKPLVAPLAGYLENLWSEALPADPSRGTILEVMTLLVKAAKHNAVLILPVTAPLITFACRTQSSSGACGGAGALYAELACAESTRARKGANQCPSDSNGFLVRDGVALWLAVMRNLTEAQYITHQAELQQLFHASMEGMRLTSDGKGSSGAFGSNAWDLSSEPASVEIVTDLMLVIEAYALLGGESRSLLLGAEYHGAITALYSGVLGKGDARLTHHVMRPLQAFLLSCPVLAGQYFNDCGILLQILRTCYASVGCPNLCKIFEAHRATDLALTPYLTFIAQLLLFNPSALHSALTTTKVEVLMFVQQTTGHADDKMLTEGILLTEIVSLMFRLFDSVAYGTAPIATAKLWSLALLSLFPPTVLDNQPVIPPGMAPTKGSARNNKPECIISRTMLMIMNTMQFTIGLAKLEQYNREHCGSGNKASQQEVDCYSLCFWFPSTVSAQQLYSWVDPLVRVCKITLKQERNRKLRAQAQREVSAWVSVGDSDGAGLGACDSFDEADDDSDENGDGESVDYDASMKASGSEHGLAATAPGDDEVMGSAITAQDGDSQRLDVSVEPIVQVHKLRMEQSGYLGASVEMHLTEKFTQLARTLGEEQFSSLRCIADLEL